MNAARALRLSGFPYLRGVQYRRMDYFFRPDFRISRYSISASVLIIALYFP